MKSKWHHLIGSLFVFTQGLGSFVPAAEQFDASLAPTITVGGRKIDPSSPPPGLKLHPDIGILADERVKAQVVHRTTSPSIRLYETRAVKTPKGDHLLMFPEGQHYGGERRYHQRVNRMLAYRSSDSGKSWQGPKVAWDAPHGMHGFIPLIPRGSNRIYCFGTEPIAAKRRGPEDCPIGFRQSDDDGESWSDVTLIRPQNDPGFKGMSVMRMCETDNGTWLLGSHINKGWGENRLPDGTRTAKTHQFLLRSEDQGRTWHVLPDAYPNGWTLPSTRGGRLEEGRPIQVGGGEVLLMLRTLEGHLWSMRSMDHGRTWSDLQPTNMVHPCAPPMVFHLSDGKTLVSFIHNNFSGTKTHHRDRSEIWVCLSTDGGRHWSEPRFLFANALSENTEANVWLANNCSYIDMFVDNGWLHIFQPHRWRQALHLTIEEDGLAKLQRRSDLRP